MSPISRPASLARSRPPAPVRHPEKEAQRRSMSRRSCCSRRSANRRSSSSTRASPPQRATRTRRTRYSTSTSSRPFSVLDRGPIDQPQYGAKLRGLTTPHATLLATPLAQSSPRVENAHRSRGGLPAMGASLSRALLVTMLVASAASAQTAVRPPVGGVNSSPDAMIFYVAHGAEGICGPGCSDWIAAEGTVQWDTYKRLINILDRQQGKKLPVVIHTHGESNLNVAVGLGRILHDRGFDTSEGATEVLSCAGKSETECFALKRPGGPLDAALNVQGTNCDIACVLMLAGGVHRTLHRGTRVILTGTAIHNRLAPNVSDEHRESLTSIFGEQYRVYLREMGVDTELIDIVDRNNEQQRAYEVPAADWTRLHLVTSAPQ